MSKTEKIIVTLSILAIVICSFTQIEREYQDSIIQGTLESILCAILFVPVFLIMSATAKKNKDKEDNMK